MIDIYQKKKAAAVLAIEEVPLSETGKYGVVRIQNSKQGVFEIEDIIEKPKSGKSPGNLVLSARFIFAPIIFKMIHRTKAYQGELRITDSIRLLIKNGYPVYGVKLEPGEKRYDIGNFGTYYRTFIELALSDKEFGKPLKEYLQKLVKGKK